MCLQCTQMLFEEHTNMRAAKSGNERKMLKARQMSLAKDYLLENKSATVPREFLNNNCNK